MFVRVTKAKSRNYVVIVRAFRDQHGRPRQKVIQNLGFFNTEEQKEKLFTFGRNLIASMEGKELFTASDVQEVKRENWGAMAITEKLFDIYKLDQFFNQVIQNRKLTYDLTAAIKFLIANRLLAPSSKLSAFNHKDYLADSGDFDLHHLYRSLDELDEYQSELQEQLFKRQQIIHKADLKAVLFDVTTLHFESQQADDLKEFGYSKDCKFNEVQVVLSLIITSDGIPIGYELFPGNQYEGNTLLPALVKLQKRYQLQDVIIVADRGLCSFNNLQAIKNHGFNYIIASRISNLPQGTKKIILDRQNYLDLTQSEEDIVLYKSIDFERKTQQKDENGRNVSLQEQLLCLYSSKRARKDAHDRERLLAKAKEMLERGSYKDKRGARKYLQIENNIASGLNLEKLEKDAMFDGYYAISYSKRELSPSSVVGIYKSLWQIEASFRTMKHFFEARPMFHWSKRRISGHIMLNFICLIFENYLAKTLTSKGYNYSQNELRAAMLKLERSELSIGGKKVLSYAALEPNQLKLLSVLNIAIPQNH